MSVLSHVHVLPNASLNPPGGGPAYVICANAPTCSVIAPPQKKLTGSSVRTSLGLYGAVCGGCGESVGVKPRTPIIEIGGTQLFGPLSSTYPATGCIVSA